MHVLFALILAAQAPSASTDTTHLVIVATTDVHGRVRGWDYVRDVETQGGLTRAGTILETLRTQYPGRVVLVDAGDLLQGNPFATFFGKQDQRQPHPIVDALNALQYDAATPGNHDFDFGLPLLRRAGVEATYHYVTANVDQATGGPLFPATVVLPRAGLRVGITGFTTPGVMVWDRAQLAGQVRVRRVAEAAPAALARLEREGANVKIVLIHAGLGGGSSYDTTGVGPENDAAVLASVTPKPDVVIVGHSHREIRDTVINGVHFVQPRNWAQSLSVVHVFVVQGKVVDVRAELVPLRTTTPELTRLTRRVDAAHEAARLWAATPLGTAAPGFDARYSRVQDGALLDFINEVQRRKAGTQLSAAAAFDVQAGFPDGDVLLRDVAGVYPYENTLRAVKISGQQLREFLEHSALYFRTFDPAAPRRVIDDTVPGFNFDVVSGVVYNIDLSRPAGQRVRGLAYEGKLVQPTDSFTLALNSYRAAGGGGYGMLANARVTYDRGEDIRDLLVEEIRRVHRLEPRVYLRPSWGIIPDSARAAVRALFAPTAPVVASTADNTLLRVLGLTDLHGQLESRVWDWSNGRAVGGTAVLKPWLDSLERVCRCTTIRLDAGDEMQGTPVSNLSFGRGTIAAMNALGIDAAAIGNHEFDWSIDTLRARMQDAHYKFVSANITDSAGKARPDWALPWTLVTKTGVKIAVIGLTTTSTPTTTAPRNVRGLAFGNGAQAVRRYLPEARAAADFVIVVAHEGPGAIYDVARGLDSGSVDLIVAGHTHQRIDTVINGIPIVEPGSSGRDIAVVDFVRVGGTRRAVRAQLVTPYADAVRPDPELTGALAAQLDAIKAITGRSVARLKVPLKREGAEYGLGRLIADAARNIGKADVGIVNNGGIRAGLPEGAVTWGDVQMVQPFQNRMLRLSVKGSVLLQALEHCVDGTDGDPDCHVSGVEVWYDPGHQVGKRVTRTRMSDGKGIDGGHTYTLVVPDFMAAGGSGFAMLAGQPAQDLGMLDMDLFISYLGVLRTPVEAPSDVRFHRAGR
ncbi:MAG TPA: 5'-nucleotidase C-terminal domain-containing protein [Gemmatimonadales bacterium]|jgi:2',3'-cyclic-nucleotide 2'-phosphodiesterase (5'-nucleotidase family)|nr:5'-nucleotidase C-terminal domain-containing protein [Gemmatimonadales bacterium]